MENVNEECVEQKPAIDPFLAKTVFNMPLDGGRLAVRFHTPRLLSADEWDRMLHWLDLMKSELVEDPAA